MTYKILSMDLYEDDFIFVFLKYSILIMPPNLISIAGSLNTEAESNRMKLGCTKGF